MKFFKSRSITSKKYIVSNDLFKNLLILPSNIKLKEKDILFIKKKIDSFLNK